MIHRKATQLFFHPNVKVVEVLLDHMLHHPHAGVKERYKRLHLSADKGNQLKNQLVAAGVLEVAVVPIGRTRRVLLRPTPEAHRTLGLRNRTLTRASIAHEYWKHDYADLYHARGYAVQVEAPRKGGRVDVQATKASERVAIEIETGKSNVLGNVKNCLASRFDRVVVVATNANAGLSAGESRGMDGSRGMVQPDWTA